MTPVLLLLLAAAPPPPARPKDVPVAVTVTPQKVLGQASASHAGSTKCGLCHSAASWTEVKFNHDRTGFPLTGSHTEVTCKACHTIDFQKPLPRSCTGCHRDVHAGDLGARCEGCHDTSTWRSRVDADAHRRTNFPLLGAHAALPCVECHFESSERRFSRAMVDCGSCHQADYQHTLAGSVNHVTFGFDPTHCRNCHGAYRFTPALFPGHDACFLISRGSHAGIRCAGCHTSLTLVSSPGTCSTRNASCTGCHAHTCTTQGNVTDTDKQHTGVAGYQCADRKCYECHLTPRAP